MKDPGAAVLNFLKDYTQFSIWHLGRHHKKELGELIERNKDQGFNELLIDLNKTFPKDAINPNGELQQRL